MLDDSEFPLSVVDAELDDVDFAGIEDLRTHFCEALSNINWSPAFSSKTLEGVDSLPAAPAISSLVAGSS